MDLINEQVFSDSIPDIDDIAMETLDPEYRTVNVLSTIFFAIVLISIYFIVSIFEKNLLTAFSLFIMLPIWGLMSGFYLWFAYKSFDFQAFAIRQNDIMYKSGIFFKSTLIIPFNRIQHCEINHGPLDRYFGLARIVLYTAGGSSSDLVIPGLPHHRAEAIRSIVFKKIAADEEE